MPGTATSSDGLGRALNWHFPTSPKLKVRRYDAWLTRHAGVGSLAKATKVVTHRYLVRITGVATFDTATIRGLETWR